jgi:hypothetical protein
VDAAVIGGGPAGLRAAEVLAAAKLQVGVFDQMPSVGRKFLVAGKGGLNLTHSEGFDDFVRRYDDGQGASAERWMSLLRDFGPAQIRDWAAGLGIETYAGTSGRIFPRSQKAAPLLRRWVTRLREFGVKFLLRHRLAGLNKGARFCDLEFEAAGRSDGKARFRACAVVLAMGGASWPETGSDGQWPGWLEACCGVKCAPWQPSNCGWHYPWGEGFLAEAEGQPLKNIVATAGGRSVAGELLLTRYGLEGGAIYQLGPELRSTGRPILGIDLKPTFGIAELAAKIQAGPNLMEKAARAWRLGPSARALLAQACSAQERSNLTPAHLASLAKKIELRLSGPRPIAEAISSAGGVPWAELDRSLMLLRLPGVFCAGEMLDWDAPTGGYLLSACLATGDRAGRSAARWVTDAKR